MHPKGVGKNLSLPFVKGPIPLHAQSTSSLCVVAGKENWLIARDRLQISAVCTRHQTGLTKIGIHFVVQGGMGRKVPRRFIARHDRCGCRILLRSGLKIGMRLHEGVPQSWLIGEFPMIPIHGRKVTTGTKSVCGSIPVMDDAPSERRITNQYGKGGKTVPVIAIVGNQHVHRMRMPRQFPFTKETL